jgi:apolipoprotein N-acyltransferase
MSFFQNSINRHPYVIALLAGMLSAVGFAPLKLWPVTLLCFAVFIHLIGTAKSRRGALFTGWIFGVGHFSAGNEWIAATFNFQETMPVWLGYFAVVALALYLAIYPALAALGAYMIGKFARAKGARSTMAFIASFAGLWIITEWLRSWLFTGFAWNPLSAAFLPVPGIGALRAIGSYGVSGAVILAAAIILGLIIACTKRAGKVIAARVLDLGLLALAMATLGWLASGDQIKGPAQAITITQPNISQAEKYELGYEEINFDRLAKHSKPLQGQGPRLLLWPEAAIPDYLISGYPRRYYSEQTGNSAVASRLRLTALMGKGDILITGAGKLEFDKNQELVGARNSMIAINDTGDIVGSYDKAHLVPYGEYLPAPWLLKPLGLDRLIEGNLDFWEGPGPRTLALGPQKIRIGFQICYEIIFSGQTVDRASRPDFIFNSSNDAWFGGSGSPQVLAQAQLRAIEEGLPVIRSTPTGISAVIDANGKLLNSLPSGVAGRIDTLLPSATTATWFARAGNSAPLILSLFLLLIAFLPVVSRRASR